MKRKIASWGVVVAVLVVGSLVYFSGPEQTDQGLTGLPPKMRLSLPQVLAQYDPNVRLAILDSQDLAVTNVVQKFSSTVSGQAAMQIIWFEGDMVRYKLYGTVTSGNGPVANDGDILILDQDEMISGFNVILDAASSAASAYTVYFRRR